MGLVVSQSELITRRGQWKSAGRAVVCASGCFELLHPGHVRLLEQARSHGDVLVVAIEGDATVRARCAAGGGTDRKIGARPMVPASERAEIVAALAAVDWVAEYEGESPREFFARLQPDVVVIGGSAGLHRSAQREADPFEGLGCKIVRVPREPGHSTSGLIERILEQRG